MLWFVVWTVLVVAALATLGLVVRSVFRKGVALVHEMGEAAELLGEAAEQAERLGGPPPDPEPAVFADPHELRRQRRRRDRRRSGRRAATR